jgi:hypothetical protein
MVAHRIRWFVRARGTKLPHTAAMRGRWDGWDAECACGWADRGGGMIKARVKEAVETHKWEVANGFWQEGNSPWQ